MMNDKTMYALLKCTLFKEMTPLQIDLTLAGVNYRMKHFDKKDVYILAGMPCKYVDIIISGTLVARMVGLSGKYVEVSRLGKGDILGPAFVFAKENKMPVSVETDTETTILRMAPSELKRLIDTDETIRMNFIEMLSNIDVFLTKKMRILSLLTVREKVAYFLLEAARKTESDVIKLDRSRQEIADSFGIQKFSLLRCLSELSDKGAIRVEGKTITLLDRSKLQR